MVAVTCYGCGDTMYVPFESAQRMAEQGNEPLCLNCNQLSDAEIERRRKRRLGIQK